MTSSTTTDTNDSTTDQAVQLTQPYTVGWSRNPPRPSKRRRSILLGAVVVAGLTVYAVASSQSGSAASTSGVRTVDCVMTIQDSAPNETFYVATDGTGALTWCQSVQDTAPSGFSVVLGGQTQGPLECSWTTTDGISVWVHGMGIGSRSFCQAFSDGLAIY